MLTLDQFNLTRIAQVHSQRAHDLATGAVEVMHHACDAVAALTCQIQSALRILIERRAHALKPRNDRWALAHHEFHHVGVVAASAYHHGIGRMQLE